MLGKVKPRHAYLAAFATLVTVAAAFKGVEKYKEYRAEEDRQANLKTTTESTLDSTIEFLKKNTDGDGRFIQSNFQPPKDAWENDTKINYESTQTSDTVTIVSAGRDKQFDTDDDVKKSHTNSGIAVFVQHVKDQAAQSANNVKNDVKKEVKDFFRRLTE